MEFVNGKDDIPYMKWTINNVPNHQPVIYEVQTNEHLSTFPNKPATSFKIFYATLW